MKPFIFNQWHAWQGHNAILLSDESVKNLRTFASIDAAINWLFLTDKPAARALNVHKGN